MKINKIMTTVSIGFVIVCLAIIGLIITNNQQSPQYARGGHIVPQHKV